MEINTNIDGELEISKVYNAVILKAERQEISVCERDGVFEITKIRAQGKLNMKTDPDDPLQF